MGTFGGHVLPGSFFIGFGYWTLMHLLIDYFSNYKCFYVSKIGYTVSFKGFRNIPFDSGFKILAATIGLLGEIITGFVNGRFANVGNAQHSTMYSVFIISGIVELIMFYSTLNLPYRSEYLFNIMSFSVEAFLFMFHLHGRSDFDIYLHLVLVVLIWLNIIFGILEMIYESQVIYQIIRCFFLVVQGTWFCQVGTILYPPFSWLPTYDENNNTLNILRAVQILSWHFSVNAALFLIMTLTISSVYTTPSTFEDCKQSIVDNYSQDDSEEIIYGTELDRIDFKEINLELN